MATAIIARIFRIGTAPLLPVTAAGGNRPAPVPDIQHRAIAPASPVGDAGLVWAEAGWRQPGVVVFVRSPSPPAVCP
jgi:hypothetical protein